MKQRRASILIPTFNRANFIEKTVESALSQTYENIEVIVVDNKSTDGTWSILQVLATKDSRLKIYQNEVNVGPVRNWLRCIEYANGYYGKILWSDDLISADFLEKTIPFLEDDNVGFVYTSAQVFGGRNDKRLCTALKTTGVYSSQIFIQGSLLGLDFPVSPGCALFRLQDLKTKFIIDIPNKIGSDFSKHAIGNDLLIFLFIASKYKTFAFLQDVMSYFREHSGSITCSAKNGELPLHYALAKSSFLENMPQDTKLIRKFNTHLMVYLLRYSGNCYGLCKISDFYMHNREFRISAPYLLNKIIKKLFTYFKP
jgi:glycosyltransferase involved in cell wall biosynthesis